MVFEKLTQVVAAAVGMTTATTMDMDNNDNNNNDKKASPPAEATNKEEGDDAMNVEKNDNNDDEKDVKMEEGEGNNDTNDKKPAAEDKGGDNDEEKNSAKKEGDESKNEAEAAPAAKPKPDSYELGTIVYKNFDGSWYFGYVDSKDGQFYHVRYEDNDHEDLSKRQMDDLVVIFEDGEIAKTAGVQKASKSRSAKPTLVATGGETGTVNIIYSNQLYSNLDGAKLSIFIMKRRKAQQESQASAEAAATVSTPAKWEPKYELGTIVCKWFDSVEGYFFGYVAKIDKSRKQYCIQFEDGDTEDSNQSELQENVVTLGKDDKIALTSKTPDENEFDFNLEGKLESAGKPGSIEIISHPSGMYSHLDKTDLEAFLSGREEVKEIILAEKAKVAEEKRKRAEDPQSAKKARIHETRSFFDAEGKLKQRVVDFYVFLHKRQKMWLRRKTGAPYLPGQLLHKVRFPRKQYPQNVLSSSDLLLEYSWCNVYRELDRGTTYFHAHIVKLREAKETWTELEWLETVLWAALVYRLVNRVATFEALDGIPTKDEWKEFETKAHTYNSNVENIKFFTGAHQAPIGFAAFCRNFKSLSKSNEIHELAEKALKAEDVSSVLKLLTSFDGVADFISWQVFCDLRQSGCLEKLAEDKFCYLGPGAKKGLNQVLVGRNEGNTGTLKATIEEAQQLVELQDQAFKAMDIDFPYWQGHKLTITEIEHGLCEYSKYCVYTSGKTNSKLRSYVPHPSKKDEKEGRFCDTCMTFRKKADFTEPPTSWICARCNNFNSLFPVLADQYATKDYVSVEKESKEEPNETEKEEGPKTEPEPVQEETKAGDVETKPVEEPTDTPTPMDVDYPKAE